MRWLIEFVLKIFKMLIRMFGSQNRVPVDMKLSTYNLDVPEGWLVPTEAEWAEEIDTWPSKDIAGSFASVLKISHGGLRLQSTGVVSINPQGYYWTSDVVDGNFAIRLGFQLTPPELALSSISTGYSVRLIKQTGLPLVSGDQSFTYNGASWTYREVESLTGRIWMDRNLGASQVASALDDALAFGDLFQWGRNIDGHQVRTSGTTATRSSSDTTGHGNFILTVGLPVNWRNPQNDNLWQPI